MASNITAYTVIPDGMPATPTNMNSRLSQLQLNVVSVNSLAEDIQSGAESLATGVIGTNQIADRAVTGIKIATSTVTTRSLGVGSVTSNKITNKSVTSIKLADGAVQGVNIATDSITSLKVHFSVPSELSFTESVITTKRIIVTDAGTPSVGDPLGSDARFKAEGIFWELTSVVGPGSEGTVGLALADTNSGPAGAYRVSLTSLPEVGIFSGNTTYCLAHSAGFIISNSSTPSSSAGAGVAGDVRWADGFLYVCVSTNSWQRAALANF